ncbi:MAG: NADH-quinone oxidoreductase subunit NuoH [Candidatus Wallbacteria bacterium]|nr:NADH-quinone oxidoreductase subunit NuoH [Candidatus Wallbacteria bacterium]
MTIEIPYIAAVLKAIAFPVMALNMIPVLVWIERRGSAFIQNRIGPNRANIGSFTFLGLLHPFADAMKFMFKEPFRPENAHPVFYFLAPALVVIPSLMALAVIPIADHVWVQGHEISMSVTELEYGIAYVFAVASIGVLGIAIAGWASNNKYSLLGGIRSTAQMISYELSLGLSVLGVLLIFGTLDLNELARGQGALLWGVLPKWGVFLQPVGFLLFVVACFAEANRLPFDLPEGDSELVAGYHTEYGGFKFSMFFMGEYVSMVTLASLIATLFFGGWQVPWMTTTALDAHLGELGRTLSQIAAFAVKIGFFLWLFIWVRWTLPRFRYDQLMRLGWKVVLPLALVNILVTALVLLLANGF